jgi:hypothetical protein
MKTLVIQAPRILAGQASTIKLEASRTVHYSTTIAAGVRSYGIQQQQIVFSWSSDTAKISF